MHRKIIAAMFSLAALCLFAPVTEVKAEEGINTYAVEGSYTLNVPTEVQVDSVTNEGTLSMTGELDACYNLEIGIESAHDFNLANTDNESRMLRYTLSDDCVVFSKEQNSTDKVLQQYDLDIRVQETPVVSGEYKDILTFKMTAKNYEPEETKHKLIFDTNCSDTVTISTNEKFVNANTEYGMLPTPKRAGYTFLGWYTEKENGEQITENTIMGTEDATVYAHWNAHILTINYHNDGADYIHWESGDVDVSGEDVTSFQKEIYGSTFSNGVSGLYDVWRWKRTGYANKGNVWKIGKDGTDEYNDHIGFKNTEDCAEYLGVLDALKKGDVTVDLYPIWIAYTYTVKYDKNCTDASGKMDYSKHTYDVEQKLSKNNFVREGYTFAGWSTSETGNVVYADEASVSNLTATKGAMVTLYAQWELVSSEEDQDGADVVNIENSVTEAGVTDEQDASSGENSADSVTEKGSFDDDAAVSDAMRDENVSGEQSISDSEDSTDVESGDSTSNEETENFLKSINELLMEDEMNVEEQETEL